MVLNIAVTVVLVALLIWLIGKTGFFCLPYENFSVTVKCSGDELRTGLKKHCTSSFRQMPVINCGKFFRKDGRNGTVILTPHNRDRNTARGRFHLSLRNVDEDSCVVEVTVKPLNMRIFCVAWLTFNTFFFIAGVIFRVWWVLLAPFFYFIFFFILSRCRTLAADEIAGFKARFHALLRTIAEEAES